MPAIPRRNLPLVPRLLTRPSSGAGPALARPTRYARAMGNNWRQIRGEFPMLDQWTYLNTASFGPLPRRGVEAALGHFHDRDANACFDFLDWYDRLDRYREAAAQLLSARAADIVFIPNTGAALSWLLHGIDWKPGDHILTLAGEFPNNLYFAAALEKRGVGFTAFPARDGLFSVDDFLACVTEKTRLVVMSTVNYSTGLRPPLETIGQALRARGVLFYVDGTQSVGALEINAEAAGIGIMAVHAYKWLCSPTGSGFAYVSPRVREWLEPSLYSWRSHRDWRQVDQLHHGAPELPAEAMKYEGGMQNFAGLRALGSILEWWLQLGPGAVESRVLDITRQTRDVLRSRGAELLSDRHPFYDSPIIAARFRNHDASALAAELHKRRVCVAARKGHLRISPHFFNNEEDLSQLDQALREVLR